MPTWLQVSLGVVTLIAGVLRHTLKDGQPLSFTTAAGMVVPDESTLEWLLPAGAHAYWRGRPVAITYE